MPTKTNNELQDAVKKVLDFFNQNSKKSLMVLLAIAGLAFVASGALWYMYKDYDSNLLAVVGSEKVTKSDYNKSAYGINFEGSPNNPQKVSEEEEQNLLNDLIIRSIVSQEAKKLNLTASEEEINAVIKDGIGFDTYNNYTAGQKNIVKEVCTAQVLLNKIKDKQIGWREGSYLVFNFHKYLINSTEVYKVEGQNDPALINKQKEAAVALGNDLATKLRNKTITFEQAKQILLNDPNVGSQAMLPRTPIMWNKFSKEEYSKNLDVFEKRNFKDEVVNLKAGEVSKLVFDTSKFEGQDREFRALLFVVDKAGEGTYPSFDDWLSAKKKEYGVKAGNTRVSTLLSKVFPKATSAFAAPSACTNACSADNANLYVTLQYLAADGSTKNLPSRSFRFVGGGSTDPALAKNDGSDCKSPSPAYTQVGTTNSEGDRSLCYLGRSYFCGTNRIAYIQLPRSDNSYTPDLSGATDDPARGYWSWTAKDAEPESGDSWYNTSDGNWTNAKLNLNKDDNKEGIQYNGSTVYNTFRWNPHWRPVPYVKDVVLENGTTTLAFTSTNNTTPLEIPYDQENITIRGYVTSRHTTTSYEAFDLQESDSLGGTYTSLGWGVTDGAESWGVKKTATSPNLHTNPRALQSGKVYRIHAKALDDAGSLSEPLFDADGSTAASDYYYFKLATAPGAPTCNISADRTSLSQTESTNIRWNASGNPTSGSVTGGIISATFSANNSGAQPTGPLNVTTTYTCSVSNALGSNTSSVTVNVNPAGLSCTPDPISGISPLLVEFDFEGSNLTNRNFKFFTGRNDQNGQEVVRDLTLDNSTVPWLLSTFVNYPASTTPYFPKYWHESFGALSETTKRACGDAGITVAGKGDSTGGEVTP